MKALIKKMQTCFYNTSLSTKICLLCTMIIVFILTIQGNVSQNLYEKDMRISTINLFEHTSKSLENAINDVIKINDILTKAPLYSKDIQADLKQNVAFSEVSINNMNYYTELLGKGKDRLYYILSLYNIAGNLVYSTATVNNAYISREYYDVWKEKATEYNGSICVKAISEEKEYACVVMRTIKDMQTFDDVGIVCICIPSKKFKELSLQLDDIPGANVIIYDSYGDLIYSNVDGLKFDEIPEELLNDIQQDGDGSNAFKGQEYIGYRINDNENKYSILVYTKIDDLFERQQASSVLLNILTFLSCIAVSILIILAVRLTTSPLRSIVKLMQRVQAGDTSVRFKTLYKDEIGILGDNFNSMLENIDKMTKEIVAVSIMKKQVEIDALQNQINPHFTYNTLETIRMLAVENDQFELADLICDFGRVLRYNIKTINEVVNIAQEIEYIKWYVQLQNVRLKNKIKLSCLSEIELKKYPILKLLIQPIIENAIFHGLEMNTKMENRIVVNIIHKKEKVIITIMDNGIGIENEALKRIKRKINKNYYELDSTSHIGLCNVNERIRLYYGEEYGIDISSVLGEGTTVSLCLPEVMLEN